MKSYEIDGDKWVIGDITVGMEEAFLECVEVDENGVFKKLKGNSPYSTILAYLLRPEKESYDPEKCDNYIPRMKTCTSKVRDEVFKDFLSFEQNATSVQALMLKNISNIKSMMEQGLMIAPLMMEIEKMEMENKKAALENSRN